jgi:type IV pilus assembly protein PilY1
MKTRSAVLLSIVAATLLSPLASAEDTDIFSGSPSSSVNPNVLIILDNASAWDAAVAFTCPTANVVQQNNAGKDVGFEQCSLHQAVTAIGNTPQLKGKLNVGLMMFGQTAVTGSNNWGGIMKYPAAGPYNLPTMDDSGVTAFTTYIKTIDRQKDSSNGSQVAGGMYEAYSFFTGGTSLASGVSYASHTRIACQRNFIIYIGNALNNGKPQDTGQTTLDQLNAAITKYNMPSALSNPISSGYIDADFTKYDANWGDEWARFLYQTNFSGDLTESGNIITYTISVTDGANPDYVQFDHSMANAGGGKAFVVTTGDVSGLVDALMKIFNEVAATNTAFASSSLPVSANSQGTFENQVFIGLFRPDSSPRWAGNLKQYQFGVTGTAPNQQLFLADAQGDPAISGAGTGFFSANAQSFWTSKDTTKLPDSKGGFWANQPHGVSQGYDLDDGEWVEKGGVAQQIHLANLQDDYSGSPTSPRNVYTCTSGCGAGTSLSTTPFATTNASISASALGISNATYSVGVSGISRSSSSGNVTVTLASTPSPAISDPTQVTISGSTGGQYDYSLASRSPSASGTTVTYKLPAEYPPMPPTASYKVTGPGAGSSNITTLTRNSDTGWLLATAVLSDATFGGGNSVATGDTITIQNSSGGYYDGSNATVLSVTGGNTITFRRGETPTALGGGGTIANSNTSNPVSIGAITDSPPGLVRGTSCSGCSINQNGHILMVNVTGGTTNLNNTNGPPANGTSATLSIPTIPQYSGTYKIVATGTTCSVTYVNSSGVTTTVKGTANSTASQPKNISVTSFCVNLDSNSTFAVYPSTSGSSVQTSPQTTILRQNASLTRDISGWKVATASNCPTSATETVEVTTSIPHGFTNGSGYAISGTNVPSNESVLVGTKTVTVTGTSTFTYAVTTMPGCTDTASGMKITYQAASGGVDPNKLIRWVRGEDNVGDEQSPGSGINIRPSVHGDVLHSRPVVVNYADTGVVVYYGANDGTFRAVNGNAPLGNGGAIGSAAPGGEIWSFVAPEFFPKLPRLYLNSPDVKLANTPDGITPTPQPKDYFFDGSTGIYQKDGTVYLVLSSRRGVNSNGKGILYGLDVSSPANPKFLWKRVGGESGFEELGQTWSTPKMALVKGYTDASGNPKPVVIFGGGYDTNQDIDPPAGSDTTGRAIYVLDAATGAIVWKAAFSSGGSAGSCTTSGSPPTCGLSDMTYSIPADITLLNRDFDLTNYIDRLYAADIGGNIWRVDLEPSAGAAPSNWKVTKLASLGGTSGSPRRKFFYPPDVIPTKQFDMVMTGTGDREHPLYNSSGSSSYTVQNRFYGLKDPNTGSDVAAGWTPIVDDTPSTGGTPTGLFHVIAPSTLYDPATVNNGFYIDMTNAGEKIVNAPTTVGGFTYFGSNTPPTPNSEACTNEGTARGYQVNFLTGATNSSVLDSAGMPPSPVAGLVNIDVNGVEQTFPFLLGANPDPTCVGPDCKSAFGGTRPPVPIKTLRRRVYWYVDKHDD